MQTPQKDKWYAGMEKEVNAMFSKCVIVEIHDTEAPNKSYKLGLIWPSQVKPDDDGYVTRFRPRIVGLGNHQDPAIIFVIRFPM